MKEDKERDKGTRGPGDKEKGRGEKQTSRKRHGRYA
jgi:hypothetical protein